MDKPPDFHEDDLAAWRDERKEALFDLTMPQPVEPPTDQTGLIIDVEVHTSALATQDALEQNPALHYLINLRSARSRQTMTVHLRNVAKLSGYDFSQDSDNTQFLYRMPWATLNYSAVSRLIKLEAERSNYKDAERGKLSPATINCLLAALRGVAKAAYQLELITGEVYQRIGMVKQVRGKRLPPGRALSEMEQLQLFEVCRRDESPAGRRDAAMFALGFGAGLRRAEIVSVTLADYNERDGGIKVLGKGNKQRKSYLDGAGQLALHEWMRVRGSEPGPILCRIRKGGVLIFDPPLTDQAVWYVLKARALEAGVLNVSPHDMRRTYISEMLGRGVGIEMVQTLVGHESPATTAKYDRRNETERRKAAQKRGLPFRAKL